MLYIIDYLHLMHDWYIYRIFVEAPTISLIGTCFMEDLAYIYWFHHFVALIYGDVWYTHIWDMFDDTTPLVLLDLFNNWHLFEIHDCGTWFMVETYHERYDTLFGILVDAQGWNSGICTWLEYW